MGLMDFLSAVLCFTSVILLSRHRRSGWFFGGMASAILLPLMFQHHLYANGLLTIYFIVMSCIGWTYWKQQARTFVTTFETPVPSLALIITTCIVIGLTVPHISGLSHYTTPLDIITTLLSITAMILQSRKFRECWLLWCFADGLYVYTFAHAGLWFNALKFLTYVFIVLHTYYHWKPDKLLPVAA